MQIKPIHNSDPDTFFSAVQELTHEEFCKAFLKVQSKAKQVVPLILNPGQMKIANAVEQCRRERKPCHLLVLKARQFGGSTEGEAQIFHRYYCGPGLNAEIVANVSTASGNMKRMFERFHNHLPAAMQPPIVRKNERVFAYNKWDSQVRFSSAESRDNVGVSDSISMFHGTEIALWPSPKRTLDYLAPAIIENENTLDIKESTARGFDYWQSMCEAAIRRDIEDIFLFVSFLDVPEYCYPKEACVGILADMTDEERNLVRLGATHGQLLWRRWYIKNKCFGSLDTFHQEMPATPEEAFVASGSCFFVGAKLKDVLSTPEPKPLSVGVIEGGEYHETGRGPLTIFKMPEKDKQYVIGVDVAGAEVVGSKNESESDDGISSDDRDQSVAVVCSVDPLETVATFCNNSYENILAKDLIALGKFYNNAWLGVERNGLGHGVVCNLIDRYDNLWCEESRGKWSVKYAAYPGWTTKGSIHGEGNRLLLLQDLLTMMREHPESFLDRRLHKQCLSFVQKRNGRWEHESGCHDDFVFATGIAMQMYISMPTAKARVTQDLAKETENDFTAADIKHAIKQPPRFIYDENGKIVMLGLMDGWKKPNCQTTQQQVA